MYNEQTFSLLVLSEELDERLINVMCVITVFLLIWYFARKSMYENDFDTVDEGFSSFIPVDNSKYLAYDKDALAYQEASDLLADFDSTLVKPRNFERTDNGYFAKPLAGGDYGNVPVYLYNDYDNERTPLWRQPSHGVYLPNSKEYWKANNYPIEADSWIANGEDYTYPFYPYMRS
jgi:hypothetical protein